MKKILNARTALLLVPFFLLGFLVVAPTTAYANNHCTGGRTLLGLPTWYEYLDVVDDGHGGCKVEPIRDNNDDLNIGATAGAVLLALTEVLLRIAGIVAIGFVIYGGFQYTTSQGSPDKLQAAQKTIVNGLVGLVIAVLAVAIVNLLSNIVM